MPARGASRRSLLCDGVERPSPSRLDPRRPGGGIPGTSLRLGRPASHLLAAVGRSRGPEERCGSAGRCGGGGPSTWRARPRWTRRCTTTSWPRTTSPWSASTASRATSSGWVPRPGRARGTRECQGRGLGAPGEGASARGRGVPPEQGRLDVRPPSLVSLGCRDSQRDRELGGLLPPGPAVREPE